MALLFGLIATVTSREHFRLPHQAHGPLGISLVFFTVAALLGVASNLPVLYQTVRTDSLRKAVDDDYFTRLTSDEAQVFIAATRIRLLRAAKTTNNVKAWLVVAAYVAQLFAVGALAIAVREVLAHG